MRRRSEPHSGSPGLFSSCRSSRRLPARGTGFCVVLSMEKPAVLLVQLSALSPSLSIVPSSPSAVSLPDIWVDRTRAPWGHLSAQYEHHSSVFPSWWAVVSAQDRVNETSGDCFYRTHETTQWDIRVHLMESTETRLCCEMSCFHCDFDCGLILGYDALFIDKQLPEVSEKLAALDS
jgi:hypothetical protein